MLNSREVKDYLSHHHIPQLLESLLTGLLYHHPADPISFLHSCLNKTRWMGGPGAVTWDSFIQLERNQLSPGPQRTTSLSLRAPPVPPRTVSVRQRTTCVPLNTTSLSTTPSFVPSVTSLPMRTTSAPFTTNLIPPKSSQIPVITQLISPIKPDKKHLHQTSALIPPIQQTSQTTSNTTPWIMPPTSTVPPPNHFGPQNASVNPQISVLDHLTAQVSTIKDKSPFGPAQVTSAQFHKLLPPLLPAPAVTTSATLNERGKQPDMTGLSIEGPPPSPVRSQLSIDSDSDLTESSGLQQEVSIRPPQKPRPLIFFIIGGPGSGKGSQAAKLAQSFDLTVVSLEELLRRQLLSQASPSRKWEVISQMMSHGELGPQCLQEETISELRRLLISQREVKGFIVDGFPRDIHQALSFQEKIGSPDLVMLMLCSNETLRSRLQRRATELGLLGDSSHALRKRLDSFQKDIVSIMRYYRQLHLLTKVNADRDEDLVFADLDLVIRGKMPKKESPDPIDIHECSSAASPVSPSNQ